jgi:plasmid stabilization system protein ParE
VTKKPSKQLRLLLTDRAVNDILDIERYSIEQFGKRVANRYLAKLEAAPPEDFS